MVTSATSLATGPTVTFWGAAQTVTGSMHLVEAGRYKVLLECGLYRGPAHEARQRNSRFPFHPSHIDAVILSHAHIDHCGNLPNLVRQGFRGPIFCTPATRELIGVMLTDSARIQEENNRTATVIGGTDETGTGLFTRTDVELTLDLCHDVPYGETERVVGDWTVRFSDAGHILGSAVVTLTIPGGARQWTITFTGDLGRRGLPYLPEPNEVPPADLLISESTYGSSVHQTVDEMGQILADVVTRTVGREGKVFIPAFSLGRTQVVLHYLRKWMAEGKIPRLPLFVDSPLATHIGRVYDRYPQAFVAHANGRPLPPVSHLHSLEDTAAASTQPGSSIIVASGGMCEAGRILRHLRHHVDDPRSSLVLVSFQAPTSLGRKLLEKRPKVRFLGREWNKWIEVVELKGFSGHADLHDFKALLGPLAGRVKAVRLVHGEAEPAGVLAKNLRAAGFGDVAVPAAGDRVVVP